MRWSALLVAGLVLLLSACEGTPAASGDAGGGDTGGSVLDVMEGQDVMPDVQLPERDAPPDRPAAACVDEDGDGYPADECGGMAPDCDDANDRVNPGRSEVCDARDLDEDCNPCTVAGSRDGDGDNDTFLSGTCANTYRGATPMCPTSVRVRSGRVAGTDCEDSDPNIRPNQTEACNQRDDNCNEEVDEGLTSRSYYPDRDNDGYGDHMATPRLACSPPPATMSMNWVANDTDCNDSNAMVNPGATELCMDRVDNNCNGMTDEGTTRTWYRDRDGDGFGVDTDTMMSTECTPPAGFVGVGGDCDDTPGVGTLRNPRAMEVCDGIDNNCNDVFEATGEDLDNDGHSSRVCGGARGTDCNDANPNVYVGALELCDGVDNDCSLFTGAASATSTPDPAEDRDGDRHSPTAATCIAAGDPRVPAMRTAFPNDDCNDAAADVYRGATETCNTIDNDCDGVGDDADVDAVTACGLPGMTATARCRAGRCEVTRCSGTRADCNGQFTDGCEVELQSAMNHCGACGNACADGLACNAGLCGDYLAIESAPSLRCALHRDGRVFCWGDNRFTQLGFGTCNAYDSAFWPVAVPGITTAVRIAVSSEYACAVLVDGGVMCWGSNLHGQVNGTSSTCASPTRVAGVSGATALVLGGDFTCAIVAGGEWVCWGRRIGTSAYIITAPETVAGLRGMTLISAQHWCRISMGRVLCRFQDGSTGNISGIEDAVELAPLSPCVRRASGGVACWSEAATVTPSTIQSRFSDATRLLTNCALRAGNIVNCWGAFSNVQITDVPINVGSMRQFSVRSDVASGVSFDGRVLAAGSNSGSGLATRFRSSSVQIVPAVIRLPRGATSITNNGAILSDRAIWAWNNTTPAAAPASLSAEEIVGSSGYVCARTNAGSVSCAALGSANGITQFSDWFTNAATLSGFSAGTMNWNGAFAGLRSESLQRWSMTASTSPLRITALWGATSVLGGTGAVQGVSNGATTCFRYADGSVRCVGEGSSGELGDGRAMDSATLVSVLGLNALELVARQGAFCARIAGGAVRCWGVGANPSSYTNANASSPVDLGLSIASSLARSDNAVCGVRPDASVQCMGRFLAPSGVPCGEDLYPWAAGFSYGYCSTRGATTVAGLSDVRELITAGDGFCARRANGEVRCFGHNVPLDYEPERGFGVVVLP